jgi:hypothetical protein
VLARSPAKQACKRFSTFAAVAIVVWAHVESVERQFRGEPCVNGVDFGGGARAARNVRLVRDDEQHETGLAQRLQRRLRIARDVELPQVGWIRQAVANDRVVHDAVAIEKDGAPQRTVSHFVSAVLSAGWDTIRCQTTAWKASACGVVLAALTVGMTTHASATRAV